MSVQITIRDVPERVRDELAARAASEGRSMQEFLRGELSKKITTPQADAAYDDLMQLEIELLPFTTFADRIWELRATVASYDAWYVCVAEAMGCPLATLDGRLAKAPGPKCEFLTPEMR